MSVEATKAFKRLRRKLEGEVLWIYISNILLDENGLTVAELKRRLKEKFSIQISTVYLYTVVYRMEREGLIKRELSEDGKSIYYLEVRGREAYFRGVDYLHQMLRLLEKR